DPRDPNYNPLRALATFFIIRFAAQSGVGTYSYAIGPNVQDRNRSADFQTVPDGGFVRFQPAQNPPTADGVPVPIPDNTTAAANPPVSSKVNVTDPTPRLADILVNLTNLNHAKARELIIRLISPDGTVVTLSEGPVNLNSAAYDGANFIDTVFSDHAFSRLNG